MPKDESPEEREARLAKRRAYNREWIKKPGNREKASAATKASVAQHLGEAGWNEKRALSSRESKAKRWQVLEETGFGKCGTCQRILPRSAFGSAPYTCTSCQQERWKRRKGK